ncbi:hypothetical protein POM88_020117 [Heracleum sosnowskyi]|uniref:Uncharacterized protein n=1 Tax=Heracleum sosnowskyi TaxID=360622 RepID=A0AAD8MRI6_9APIA|nr:hypothetical protein POM88_020117 [Heracleum sosnowskyi]
MECFKRPTNEMHKYGAAECPNYREYPSFFTIKLYYGGHFEDLNSKFVNYKIDYFDFCNVDLMSMFEVGSMVSESIGRKSVGLELYFKSSKEEPLTVEGLPLGNTDIPPVIEKYGNRPIVGEGGNDGNEGRNDGGRIADESGHNVDEGETDGNQDEDDAEWFPDSSNDGNSNFEDFGDVTSEYKWWNMNDNLYEEQIELNDENNDATQGEPNQGEANEGEPNQGEANQGQANQGQAAQGQANEGEPNQGAANQMDNNEGNDATHGREEDGQKFPNEIFPEASQPATEIDDSQ